MLYIGGGSQDLGKFCVQRRKLKDSWLTVHFLSACIHLKFGQAKNTERPCNVGITIGFPSLLILLFLIPVMFALY